MNIFIIILAYIANVFLSRFLNRLLVIKDRYKPIVPFFWFVPFAMIIIYVFEVFDNNDTWFTGKNWRR